MPKRATQVILPEKEREELVQITRRHRSEQQQACEQHRLSRGAGTLQCTDCTRAERSTWIRSACGGIAGWDCKASIWTRSVSQSACKMRPDQERQPKITPEQRCQIAAMACEAPMKAGRPISQWTGREIADELMKRGIVEQISPGHASYLLKKGGLQPHRFRYWLNEVPDAQRDEKIRRWV